jgi:hypothetical protein
MLQAESDSRYTFAPEIFSKFELSTSVLKNCAHLFQVCFEDVNTDGAPDISLHDMMVWCTLL